jgi:hypothetical protein
VRNFIHLVATYGHTIPNGELLCAGEPEHRAAHVCSPSFSHPLLDAAPALVPYVLPCVPPGRLHPNNRPQHYPPPPGIRTYYLNRSQPPLFSDMVRIVYEATGNRTLLR